MPMTSVTTRLSTKRCRNSALSKWCGITGLVLSGLLFSTAAGACQICVPLPQDTLADRLLDAETVVLAREDPERPFQFVAVETLKGEVGNPAIEAFLNSQARRVLAVYPERAMMLVRGRGSDQWKTLGIADAEVSRVIRHVVAHADRWSPRETSNPQRLETFVPLLGHENRMLHELAYLEIGRAPYGAIRDMATKVSADKVRSMLDNPGYMEWRSLAILMLAQSGNPADEARIRNTFDDKQRFGSTLNLAAWATAYIAVDGAGAISRIEHLYLANPDRSPEEVSAVVQALSVQANDDPELRDQVGSAYRTLLEVHPEMAKDITHDLIAWRRWDFVEPVSRAKARRKGADPLGAYALDLYLNMAAANAGETAGSRHNRDAALLPPITEN